MSVHARAPLPIFLQQGRGEMRTLVLRNDNGGKHAVSGGTYTLLDSAGKVVINAAPCTVAAGVPTYTLAPGFAATYQLPQHPWRERWALSGLTDEPFTEAPIELEVFLCRVAPVQHLDLEELYELHHQWRTWVPRSRPAGGVGELVSTAWKEMVRRLLGMGVLPHRVLNWWSLATVHKYWAASLIARDFGTDNPSESRWADLADTYWERSQDELEKNTQLQLDSNEDGVADTPGQLQAAEPQLFLTDLPRGRCW